MRQNASTVEEARAAAKEATQVGKATLEMAREIKNKAPQQQQTNGPTSYAAAAARGLPLAGVKIVSSNQLKSGDLSVKAATSTEIPTYGVLTHGIRTSIMNMDRFEDNRSQILQDNRPFIPQAEIRHIGWLTRDATAKTALTITIKFTRPEDANKIIDEGLVWQGEVFQCEQYERQCRVKQCFKC
ncbi:hypothetical protein COCVIDRAFT_32089 [Bipolaris victoriae FI3]|uniref:Uncharacterized protein n=1 Tax=Bipolaris victoriae (strain FI3) TaxID=930091 RepID=W7DZU4_BIPV3|nr:hypothetical protein COCVIDRAFT_32089 [Bipolaris victoriae FI3]